ncbi:MAG: hypothetical protein HYY96_08300 [Candidatus Tectomicrobia bacterium]|nr:hypothetical protein [Candidatus Tectomicrobia bacterium]
MLDGILLEKRGTPAAVICTDAFMETGRAMAASWGKADYAFAGTAHPIANADEEELRRKAEAVIPEVERLLGL